MIKDRTATETPLSSSRSSHFLGCFGFSGEKIQLSDEVNLSSSPIRSRRWSFGCKKSSTEIANVDFTTVHRKSKSVTEAPTKTDTTLTKTHVDENHAPATSDERKSISRKKWTDIVKRESGSFRSRRKETKPVEITATSTDVESDKQKLTSRKKKADIVKGENLSFSTRRKETKWADTSVTGTNVELPEKKTETTGHLLVSSPLKPLTHSKSLPVLKKQKPPKAPIAGTGVNDGFIQKPPPPSGGDFDSIIAMSILLTILVIMVLWGKLCAIFCTCAWFFMAPRLVAAAGEHSTVAVTDRRRPELQDDLKLESVEYKKKVVLEGLLQRNHRNVVGRL